MEEDNIVRKCSMDDEIKPSIYMNPIMEDYEVDGQISIFDIIGTEKKEKIPFELCMNPPVE